MKDYNPFDWYWIRKDGSLYASGRGGDVSAEAAGRDIAYQAWLKAGGAPTPYPRDEAGQESRAELVKVLAVYGLRVYPLSLDEIQADFTAAIQAHLDRFARTRNYDGIMSAATYATSAVPKFRAEGQYAVEARDGTWAKGYELMDEVLSGQRPLPTIEEVLAELPALEWPEA